MRFTIKILLHIYTNLGGCLTYQSGVQDRIGVYLCVALATQHHQVAIVELAFRIAVPRNDVMDLCFAILFDRFAAQLTHLTSLHDQLRFQLCHLITVARLMLLFLLQGAMVCDI